LNFQRVIEKERSFLAFWGILFRFLRLQLEELRFFFSYVSELLEVKGFSFIDHKKGNQPPNLPVYFFRLLETFQIQYLSSHDSFTGNFNYKNIHIQ